MRGSAEVENICDEEIDNAILLKKDKEGNVIGVEIISMEAIAKKGVEIPYERAREIC